MRHPEIMLGASGARVGVEFLLHRMEEVRKERPDLPMSTLLAQEAVPLNPTTGERASVREMPYILGLLSKHPIYWELDPALAAAMLATDPPDDPGLHGLRLPHSAIWVGVPPIFEIWNEETGMHKVEGFYIAEDWIPSRNKLFEKLSRKNVQLHELHSTERNIVAEAFQEAMDSGQAGDVLERAVLVLVVGESRSKPAVRNVMAYGHNYEVVTRDDALLSFWIFTEDPERKQEEYTPGSDLARKTVINFLMALQSDYLSHEKVVPKKPKSPKKVARAERRGESYSEYSVIRLGKRYSSSETAKGTKAKPGEQRDRIIRGHWAHYWVLEENVGSQVRIEMREREDRRPLYKIRRWIRPVIIGNPPIKTYLVK